MPAPGRRAEFHIRFRFRIKIATTETRLSVTNLDEARAVTIESFGCVPTKDE